MQTSQKTQPVSIFRQAVWLQIDRFAWPAFLAALVLGVALLTALRISGTSVGMLHIDFHGSAAGDGGRLVGWPRGIRSDEFTVATGWTAAQARAGFPALNPLFGASGQNLLFYDIPVKDFTLLFKPHHWGFLVLPLEQAFAFKWWFRAALFLFAVGLILRRISRRQSLFAVLAALALFWMPHIQWWYSVTMMDIVTYSLLAFEVLVRLVRTARTAARLAWAGLLAWLLTALVLLFYPPTQVVAGLLLGFFGLVFLWRERRAFDRAGWLRLAAALALAAGLIGAASGAFYLKYQPVIQAVSQTVYPGKRVSNLAGLTAGELLSGVFAAPLLDDARPIPAELGSSQPEAAGFFFLGLLVLPALLTRLLRQWRTSRRADAWGLALCLAYLAVLLAQIFGLPAFFARLPGLSYLTTPRLLLPLGVLDFLLIAWYLTRLPTLPGARLAWAAAACGLGSGLLFAGLGLALRAGTPGFLSTAQMLGTAAAAGLTCAAIFAQRRLLSAGLLLGLALFSSYKVNPLYRGLGELTSGALVRAVAEIDQADGGDSAWILYGTPRALNLVQAGGARALSGVYYHPDLALWRALDPGGLAEDVYNRYARVTFQADEGEPARFELTSPDAFTVRVDPCSQVLTELGVRYHVFDGVVPHACLREVRRVAYPAKTFIIYERSGRE